jgi:hypothetical protein
VSTIPAPTLAPGPRAPGFPTPGAVSPGTASSGAAMPGTAVSGTATPGTAPVPQGPTAGESAPQAFSLRFADGTRHPLDRSILLGRGPAARPDWPEARLLPVVDPDKSVSKTHAGIRVRGDELRVEDLRSTNGVTVVHTDGSVSVVESGVPLTVAAGDTVSLGQFTLQILLD